MNPQRWPRSQPWPAPLPSSILAPASRPPAAGPHAGPDPREGASPLDSQLFASAGVFRPHGPIVVGALRPPQTLTVLSRTGHHVRAPRAAVRHSGRQLPPRFTANGRFPSSQPGLAPSSNRTRPLIRPSPFPDSYPTAASDAPIPRWRRRCRRETPPRAPSVVAQLAEASAWSFRVGVIVWRAS